MSVRRMLSVAGLSPSRQLMAFTGRGFNRSSYTIRKSDLTMPVTGSVPPLYPLDYPLVLECVKEHLSPLENVFFTPVSNRFASIPVLPERRLSLYIDGFISGRHRLPSYQLSIHGSNGSIMAQYHHLSRRKFNQLLMSIMTSFSHFRLISVTARYQKHWNAIIRDLRVAAMEYGPIDVHRFHLTRRFRAPLNNIILSKWIQEIAPSLRHLKLECGQWSSPRFFHPQSGDFGPELLMTIGNCLLLRSLDLPIFLCRGGYFPALPPFVAAKATNGGRAYHRKGFKQQPTDYYFPTFFLLARKVLWGSSCSGSDSQHPIESETVRTHGSIRCNHSLFWRLSADQLDEEMITRVKKTDYFRAEQTANDGTEWKNLFANILPIKSAVERINNAVKSPQWSGLNAYFLGFDSPFGFTFHRKIAKEFSLLTEILEAVLDGYDMADHGHRFAKLWKTHRGQLEERLLFFSIRLPKAFRVGWGRRAWESLKENAERLTTSFGDYSTLAALLDWSTDEQRSAPGRVSQCSLSLRRPVPKERTCADSEIAPHGCMFGAVCSVLFVGRLENVWTPILVDARLWRQFMKAATFVYA